MEAYLAEEEIPHERIAKSLHRACLDTKVTPVLCGSSFKNKGVQPLLDAIVALLPSPLEVPPVTGVVPAGKGQSEPTEAERPADDDGPFAALAFKVYGYLPGRAARQQYLHEVCRLLRPDAPLLLTQYVVTAEIFRTYRLQADHQRAAARFPSLESGDAFTLGGEGYLHVFTPAQLRRELVSSGLDLVTFVSDRPHGGEGWLRFAVLRKPSPDVESRPTLVASAGGTEDTP